MQTDPNQAYSDQAYSDQAYSNQTRSGKVPSDKNYGITVCLAGIFGILGIHHFYLGCWIHGLFDLTMTIAGFGFVFTDQPVVGWGILAIDWLHTMVVTIMLLVGAYKDGRGHIVTYPGQELT